MPSVRLKPVPNSSSMTGEAIMTVVGDAVVDERDGHLFGDHVLGLEAHEVLEDGHGRDRAGEIVRKTGHVASPQNAGIRPERERMPGLSSRGPGHQRPWSWPA